MTYYSNTLNCSVRCATTASDNGKRLLRPSNAFRALAERQFGGGIPKRMLVHHGCLWQIGVGVASSIGVGFNGAFGSNDMSLLVFVAAGLSTAAATVADPPCTLTATEKLANAKLSFDDFDQKGALPSTPRALGERGCLRLAAEAAEDYLLNGPARSDYHQRVILWHMAQSLALAGDERRAAQLMAGTRVPTGNNENLDWNSYVRASWAFLVKDRPAFDVAAADLARSARPSDRVNSAIISGMGRCWAKPYRVAYDLRCRS